MTRTADKSAPKSIGCDANPLHAFEVLSSGAKPNTAAAQRERVRWRLHAGPATVVVLSRDCHCPSPKKRISELRRAGYLIRSDWIEQCGPDGTVSPAVLYTLQVAASLAQTELFLE